MNASSRVFGTILAAVCVCALATASSCAGEKRPTHKADYDVIVIGGGMGGLSAGAHLASRGMKVLLLEQHDKVGGCTTSFSSGEFTFEVALHEMCGGGPGKRNGGLYQLLKTCGVDKKVTLFELPHFYRSIFPGVDITLPNNWDGVKKALIKKWPGEAQGVEKFQKLCTTTMDEMMTLSDLFRKRGLGALATMAMVPFRQGTFYKWKDRTLKDLLDECFTSEDIKAVVSQLWVYYGAPVPDQTALLTLVATDSYLNDGIWHVRGTSQALSNAYAERIGELGGVVKTGTLVTRIIMEDGMARGVMTQTGEKYTARYIVANTDPFQLIDKLVGEKEFPSNYVEKIRKMKPANSLFGVFLGLNIDLKKRGYKDTEIFYNTSKDSRTLHDAMMKGDFKNGAVCIAINSNYDDPIYAPKGKSVVKLDAYSSIDIWPKDKEAYYRMKEEKMNELIALASKAIPELADKRNIAVKIGYTPSTLERFTMNKGGVVYGFYTSPEQWQRIPYQTPIDNVFIASNWTQGFHGVGSTQISGWCAARLIMDREGME